MVILLNDDGNGDCRGQFDSCGQMVTPDDDGVSNYDEYH